MVPELPLPEALLRTHLSLVLKPKGTLPGHSPLSAVQTRRLPLVSKSPRVLGAWEPRSPGSLGFSYFFLWLTQAVILAISGPAHRLLALPSGSPTLPLC